MTKCLFVTSKRVTCAGTANQNKSSPNLPYDPVPFSIAPTHYPVLKYLPESPNFNPVYIGPVSAVSRNFKSQ